MEKRKAESGKAEMGAGARIAGSMQRVPFSLVMGKIVSSWVGIECSAIEQVLSVVLAS
jgi:hypothetical protein